MTSATPLAVILGPTAVGKSRVAIRVAKALNTEVLTADSRQVYRGMDIGTEKPTEDEREGIPHRLIDLVDPDERFNVGLYQRLARAEIDRLSRLGRVPLVVGGTGLYVRALIRGLCEGPSADWELRARLMREASAHGVESLHRELRRVDPELATRLHPRDEVKILRALEVYHLTGRRLSELHREHADHSPPSRPLLIGLERDRQALYRRIEERVERQLAGGLLRETESLLQRGYRRDLASMKGLGYRQMGGYLAGEYDYMEAVRRLKRDTRRFAKRQYTWFRKERPITWLWIAEAETDEQVGRRVVRLIGDYLAGISPSNGTAPGRIRVAG